MKKRECSIYNILSTALRSFHTSGYSGTNIRQIADSAGVSLGMVNHYFGSKEKLGAQVLSLLGAYTDSELSKHLSFGADPVLYDLASVRILFDYIRERGYWSFYVDALQYDFFFNYLSESPPVLIDTLRDFYSFTASDDDILLYSRYMPYMLEKTLVLKKQDGEFAGITYDDIPYMICQTAMNRFVPERDIKSKDAEGRHIAKTVLSSLSDEPPSDVIGNFAIKYSNKQ